MIHQIFAPVDCDDIDTDRHLRLSSVFRMLQYAAVNHSCAVGLDPIDLVAQGYGWMLSRMEIQIEYWPVYGDRIDIRTWSRGINGFRAEREFDLRVADRSVLHATSRWLYTDLRQRRLQRAPADFNTRYGIEPKTVFDGALDRWQPDPAFVADQTKTVTLRATDFDLNGHVNNAVYVDYLAHQFDVGAKRQRSLHRFRIQFKTEIGHGVESVTIGTHAHGGQTVFKIFGPQRVHAIGDWK